MSAWTQLIEPGPALLILVLALTPQLVSAAPSASQEYSDQSTEIEYYPVADATGCYYNFEHYDEGDRIITNEPCLNCTCHNRMLMCYLRVCPFTKAIGQDCKVEKKADQCCPVITCPEVHVQLLPHASTTASTQLGHPSEYGCTIENLFYADGAKVPSNPNNPCEVCYCIRNKTACIIQDCTLTGKVVEGCRPVYVDGVCCPVRYDCDHPEIETTPRPLLTTTTTTLPPTSAPTDCIYNNEVYSDGALVKKDVPCEQCYCMRGDIVCAVQECGPTPLDKVNCTALPPKEGQCCPDTYECENISEEDLTTLSYYEVPTTLPTIREGEDEGTTKASIPQITLADDQVSAETEGRVSESATQVTGDHTSPEEIPVTESVTIEAFTSKVTDAIEAVTSKFTEIIEAVTSTITGTEKDTTEAISIGSELEPEATTVGAVVTDKSEQITEKSVEGEHPVTEYEEQTDHGVVVTEGIVQETQTPQSDDQKLAITIPEKVEHIAPVTTEIPVQDITTEFGEPIAHDGHEDAEQEELPHEHENEVTEGSGIPTEGQVGATQPPQLDTEDKHTRPIDQTEIEEKPHTTEQYESEIETTRSPIEAIPHEDENQIVEGSGLEEQEPIGTLAPKPEAVDHEQVTEQPEVKITEEPEVKVTEVPGVTVTEEPEVKVTEVPGVTVTEESEVEITEEPEVKVTEEPEVKVTEKSEVKVTEEPEVKATEEPEVKVTGEPEVTATEEPEVKVTEEPGVEATEESKVKVTEEPERLFSTTEIPVEPETHVTGTLSTDIAVEEHTKTISEELVTSEPVTPSGTEQPGEEHISPEYCSGESCRQTIEPIVPLITTEKPELEVSIVPEVETTITEQETHVDVTKQPEESFVTDETETKLPEEIITTESLIPESVKPGVSLEEERVSEPKETTTKIPSDQETTLGEKEPSEPSATEAAPITETQKIDIEIPQEKEKPSFDGTEEGDHVTTEKEEIQYVTEIPTSETKKPQSMDHVFETISPDSTSIKPESEVHETEKPVEVQTTEHDVYTTELPKLSETIQPGIVKPESEHPVEEVTELSENKTEVTTENISGITEPVSGTSEIPVACDNENGCASGQQESNKIPEVIESCTKENCAPQEQMPQSESGKETGIAPESPVSCDSEQECAPTVEKEGITETQNVPDKDTAVECNTESGCPSPGSEKEGQIPETTDTESCDNEAGCTLTGTEKEINQTAETSKLDEGAISEPCNDETSCTPTIPEKEGETPVTESDEKEKLPEVTTTSEEIVSNIPQKVTPLDEEGSGQPPAESEVTGKPDEIEGSGHEIEGSGQKPEDTQHTEGSGEDVEGSGHISTEGAKSEEVTEESVTHADETIEQVTTKPTPYPSEEQPGKSTEGEQIVTVTATTSDLENEIEPESTLGPEQIEIDKGQTSGIISSEGTQSPEIISEGTQTPEILTQQTTEVPEIAEHEETESPEQIAPVVTKAPQHTATEGEIPEITEVPASIAPEATQTPEEIETQAPDATSIPEVISTTLQEVENELAPDSTQTPGHIEPEGTSSPYEKIPVSTYPPKQEVTKSPEQDVTNVTEIPEKVVPEGTEYPEIFVPVGTHLPQGDVEEVSKSTQFFEEATDSTTSEYAIPTGTEFTEEIYTKRTSKPDHEVTESTDFIQQVPSESTNIPESTENPEKIYTDVTRGPEDAVPQTTHHIEEISTGSTHIPEGAPESTQSPEVVSHEIQTTEGIDSEATQATVEIHDGIQEPESTVSSVDLGAGETETPGGTQIPEHIIPESTGGPENLPTEKVTESPEQIAPESTHVPEEIPPGETKEPESKIPQSTQSSGEISETTHIPENIPETTQAPDSKFTETETTETYEQTQSPEKVAPEGSQLPEHTATSVPEFPETTQASVQATTESEIEEEEEHGIPGEGNCLVDGQTYKNNSNVPPINQCQTSCKCISSILQCESVSCTPPPNNLQDCMRIFHSSDSCCPIYSCSVPGVTSMKSDSHVVETTTAVQEEDKPVTIGIQIIPSEEITDKSSEVSVSPEEVTTIGHIGEETGGTERTEVISETPTVPIHELTTSKSAEEETVKPETSEPLTTEKTESGTEKLPEADTEKAVTVIEVVTKETVVPELQTDTPGIETTDDLSERKEVTTQLAPESARPVEEEQHPLEDEIENEISEIPIVPEHCGVDGCQVPVLPTEETRPTEKPVTEAAEVEIEHTVETTEEETTEKHEEPYTSKPNLEPTEVTQTEVTEPAKETELPTSKVSTATEQISTDEFSTTEHIIPSEETSTDKKVSELPGSTVTERPEQEGSTSVTEGSKISDEGATVSEFDYTKHPESVTEPIVEPKPSDEEHIPSDTETPITEKIREELSTESEETSESATEAISEETKSPEEIAAIPEIEEAATFPSTLPESVTETKVEATSPSEKLPETVETENPIIVETVAPDTEPPVEQEITTEAQEPTEGAPIHDEELTESQPEIRYPDRVSTGKPEYTVQTTEAHETIQTTTSTVEHITEFDESITSKPIEAADHVTEVVEEGEKTVTTRIEGSSESTTAQAVEEPATDIVITSIPQEESKPEGESVTEAHLTTLPTSEEKKDKPSEFEFTTISAEIGEVTQPILQEKETEKEGPIAPVTEGGITVEKEHEISVTEKEKDITQPEEGEFPTHAPVHKETDVDSTPSVTEKETVTAAYVTTETPTAETVKSETETILPTEKVEEGMFTSPQLTTPTTAPSNVSELYTSIVEELSTKKSVEGELSTSATVATTSTIKPSTSAPAYVPPPIPGHEIPGEHVPEIPDYQSPVDDYEDEDQSPLGPGTCRYGGKVYVSAQQIPRDDPCDFCFCFRSDIICLQQSCPPPIPRCHEEPIRGFCCPRYECPVGMAMAVNVTTSTTTTTTTLPPHFLAHAYKGRVTRSGCQIKGRAYQVGAEITSASGPCLHCTCGGDGEMKCDPKACSPEPMLRQMIAAAASRRRR